MLASMTSSKFTVPPVTTPPILVDSREAARLLSISPRKLWDLTSHGEIPSLKFGRCVRYRVSDLNDWAAAQVTACEAARAGE
jgi:excisionase family DNA binding protein